ncbi:MAG: 5-methylcytosine-specific restriction endonuclease system specificity protein McrC [Deltaproteobacteria bacterium]|nr:5-methylcytosine-specific restriction endonuclease system specificity protein McrC [Deltaproteobacteria bacterium]
MNATLKIPILNIYYLLCYAWNKLEERDIVDVKDEDCKNLVDLFAKVLVEGLNHLFKRGLDRGYVTYTEDSRCLRGKICFAPSVKRNLLVKAQIHCEYDELNHNVLHNQILKTTIRSLIHAHDIDRSIKNDLIGLYRRLHKIESIQLNHSVFSRVQLHQNNAFYDFLLKICELIYNNLLVSEDPGKSKFRDFLQDKKAMARLFEEFVRNFYKTEAPSYRVDREYISWDVTFVDEISALHLPRMETDISIEQEGSKMVIETKFSEKTLVAKREGMEKIYSGHLYQLFAYLKNLEVRGGIHRDCSGLLLCPTVDKDVRLNYMMQGHKVMVRTINLNQHWKLIHNDLMDILECM